MEKIKPGDPQPLPCSKCGDKMGYALSDLLSLNYTTYYLSDGAHDGGRYSDYQRVINEGKTAMCFNCGEKLDFKLDRSEQTINAPFKLDRS